MNRATRGRQWCGWTCFAVVLLASSANAISISFNWDPVQTHPNDPSGTWIRATADAAALYWMDYLPESGDYEIDLAYDQLGTDPDGSEYLGLADSCGADNFEIWMDIDPSDGWFVDPTPTTHSEYDFSRGVDDRTWSTLGNRWVYNRGQWLYRDLDSGEKSGWFEGNPPGSMEVGYRGEAKPWTGGDLHGWARPDVGIDMFSTMIHEIGHILGVNDCDVGDPNWEADPSWVGGVSGVEFERDDDAGHIDARTALMCPSCGLTGVRRLPSAIDIMAVADDEGMTDIDLPRKVHLQGIWHNSYSWLGGRIPDQSDDAYIRHGDNVSLTANAAAKTLTISHGSTLLTEDHQLQIHGGTEVVSAGSVPSEIWVMQNGQVLLDDLTLAGGVLDMQGGLATLSGITTITNNAGFPGEISGRGTVDVFGRIINDGIIASDSELTFNTLSPSSRLDLDGSGFEDGIVDARNGKLTFNGVLADDFQGEMRIGVGDPRSITMSYDWTLGIGGRIRFSGGSSAGSAAQLLGPNATTTIGGFIHADGFGMLATKETIFESTSAVAVLNAGDRLILASPTFFHGGIYVGDGAIEQQAQVQVWETTSIDTGEYDWGNSVPGAVNDTYINEGVTFTINSSTTGTVRNEYRGTIYVTGSTLEVNLDSGWLLPGRDTGIRGDLILTHGDMDKPIVRGVPLTVEGAVRANGLALMEADFITSPSALITAVAGAELRLQGQNTFAGGQISGDGEIGQWGNTNVVAPTTINTQYYDLDGKETLTSQTTIHSGVGFTINSLRIDKPGESFDGTVRINGGSLTINTAGTWSVGPIGALELSNENGPAIVAGSPLVVDGTIVARGGNEVYSAVSFRNSAKVTAVDSLDMLRLHGHTNYEGGSYTGGGGILQDATAFVNAPTVMHLGFFDMDGTQENSLVELHADLTLHVDRLDLSDNRFHGALRATDSARFNVHTSTPWSMAGTLEVMGASGTQLTVGGADLILDADTYIAPQNLLRFEADVSGPGDFTGGGKVVFAGGYSPGHSPAWVSANRDVFFESSARLFTEIGGTQPGTEYDVLDIAGKGLLAGRLDVALIGLGGPDPFVPALGDSFAIIRTGVSLTATFDSHHLPFIAPGIGWDVIYGDDELILQVITSHRTADFNGDTLMDCMDVDALVAEIAAGGDQAVFDLNGDGSVDHADLTQWLAEAGQHNLPSGNSYLWGDANLDSHVDTLDFNIWNDNKFTNVAAWCRADFSADGAVDVSDLHIWNDHKFTSADGTVNLVPEPNGLTMLVIGMLMLRLAHIYPGGLGGLPQ